MINPYLYPGLVMAPKKFRMTQTRKVFIQYAKAVCDEYHVTPTELKSRSRFADVRVPRQILQTLLRLSTGMSTTEIGLMVGKRDHATVLHSVKAVKAQYQTDNVYREKLNNVIFAIGGDHIREKLMR